MLYPERTCVTIDLSLFAFRDDRDDERAIYLEVTFGWSVRVA